MGVKHDVADFFRRTFEESGVADHVAMFSEPRNDPVVERLITPKVALTVAEYLAFEQKCTFLVILTDMTSFAEACVRFPLLREKFQAEKDSLDICTVNLLHFMKEPVSYRVSMAP